MGIIATTTLWRAKMTMSQRLACNIPTSCALYDAEAYALAIVTTGATEPKTLAAVCELGCSHEEIYLRPKIVATMICSGYISGNCEIPPRGYRYIM